MSDETPVPDPTQAEADAFKEQVHGITDDPTTPSVPSVVDVPYLGGTGTVGSTLTCTQGNWNGEPTSYAYAWKSDGTTDLMGSGATYVVADTDVGHSISCVVTASNDAGSATAPPSNAVSIT